MLQLFIESSIMVSGCASQESEVVRMRIYDVLKLLIAFGTFLLLLITTLHTILQ